MQVTRRQALSSLGALLALPAFSALTAAAPRAGSPRGSEFLAAVRNGLTDRVRAMLAEDATLARAQDERGRSAYVLAHVHGHEQVAEVLRSTGLELDIVEAVLAQDWMRFEALGDAHPELLDRAHPIGGSPVYAAALVGSLDFWRLRWLGCDADAAPESGSGFTPARGAMESARRTWANISLTDLCSNGSDVNARQRGGSSILHGAVLRRDEKLVRLAIRKGAHVEALDEAGRSARALAAEIGWEQGERLLAEHAGLPRDNRSSRFALDANREPIVRPDLSDLPRAMQSQVTSNSHGRLEAVRELVSKDERLVFSISTDDELAIEASAHMGNRPIMRYHLDHGAPLSLPTAVSLGDLESVAFWLERDPTLANERGAHDFPVMWYAVLGGGSVEMAEKLAHSGIPVDQESLGTTALHWCVLRRDAELALWLIEHGADTQAVGFKWSREGQTPLQIAAEREDTKMAALLKDAGAR
jgi:ankyrin repeat protein